MAGTDLFRTSFVGGYNKSDVMEYVKKLEGELEQLRAVKERAAVLEKSVSEMLEKQQTGSQNPTDPGQKENTQSAAAVQERQLPSADWLPEGMTKEEFTDLKEKAKKYDESYDAIKKLLLDSRIEAQVILKDAKMKADKIVKDAETQAIERSRASEMRLLTDAQYKAMKIVREAKKKAEEDKKEARKMIAVEIKDSAGQLQEEIKVIQASIQMLVDQFPSKIEQRVNEKFLAEDKENESTDSKILLGEDL